MPWDSLVLLQDLVIKGLPVGVPRFLLTPPSPPLPRQDRGCQPQAHYLEWVFCTPATELVCTYCLSDFVSPLSVHFPPGSL